MSLIYSFTNYRLGSTIKFADLDNYIRLFTRDADFIKSLKATGIFTIAVVPGKLILSLAVAMYLNRDMRGINLAHTCTTVLPCVMHALSEYGHTELAYSLLLRKDYPSWLFSVWQGATTVWEHWDGIREDGSFWSADMNSYNHYAYGSVAGLVFIYNCNNWYYLCKTADDDGRPALAIFSCDNGAAHSHGVYPLPEGCREIELSAQMNGGDLQFSWALPCEAAQEVGPRTGHAQAVRRICAGQRLHRGDGGFWMSGSARQ